MNLPRLSEELVTALRSEHGWAKETIRAIEVCVRKELEQWMREQKPAAYCRPDDPQNSTAFAWPGTDREEGHLAPLYAAPVPASQGDRWLPIETAPKDGTAFLACLDGSDIPVGLRFTATGSLVLTWDGYTVNLIDWPKHWMRIPAAPVATKEAEHG